MSLKIILPCLVVLSLLSLARAYPPDDPRNYWNMGILRTKFEFNHSVRNLKADLEFIPSCDAKTALLADFQTLQEYPNIEWYDEPEPEAYQKILQDEKALESLLKFKPVTRKKFHRDEKAFDEAYQNYGG